MKVNLSDGEWKLMNKLWQGAPLTITQLTAALHSETGWGKHTVITMLSRLEAKGAVAHDGGHPAKRYSAVLKKEDAAQSETRSFLDKVYGGRLGLMMSAMVDSRALTQEDIDELTAILESAKEGD
ncbi:BlaI/MecI/CopY family transcriptional regulator [Vermiculatibacterium agrestimuris]|uniref:BlaI/MecI/CopY family transcriptional regulator n=1 Tax=Vermiculatibacterium agrestimuris TaxID=2941519 RepID=UPI00203B958D|nr:BlaI/MecI/CopY family transcriptional regulator [Vermiculatibacterium agrestimuris]